MKHNYLLFWPYGGQLTISENLIHSRRKSVFCNRIVFYMDSTLLNELTVNHMMISKKWPRNSVYITAYTLKNSITYIASWFLSLG